jgi:hypothetical protein
MSLFSVITRTFAGTQKESQSSYEFLDQSSWSMVDRMRQLADFWAGDFIADKEFIKRFQSENDKHHDGAVLELLAYQMMMRTGLNVDKHPECGGSKAPDFKVYDWSNALFVECTLSSDSFDNEKEKAIKRQVYKIIEQMPPIPHWVNISINSISSKSISKNKFVDFLHKQSANSIGMSQASLALTKHRFEQDGWSIEVGLLHKGNPAIRKNGGYTMGRAKVVTPEKNILQALGDKKPSKYRIANEPYLIILSSQDIFADDHSFCQALFGQFNNETLDITYPSVSGLFIHSASPQNTSISAVAFCKKLGLYTLDCAEITIWHNPWAIAPIPHGFLPFGEVSFQQNGQFLQRRFQPATLSLAEYLGLNPVDYASMRDLISKEIIE